VSVKTTTGLSLLGRRRLFSGGLVLDCAVIEDALIGYIDGSGYGAYIELLEWSGIYNCGSPLST